MARQQHEAFAFPAFWNYPPYFTLQPVKETQQKQRELWTDLVLRYCRHRRLFVVSTDETEDLPLWHNRSINRKLGREARLAIIGDLVAAGRALWFDRTQRQALVLWRTIVEWAELIAAWARGAGMEGAVLSLEDLTSGIEVKGSELEGLHREVLLRALRQLEQGGKCRLFKGSGADDEGVKFGHGL